MGNIWLNGVVCGLSISKCPMTTHQTALYYARYDIKISDTIIPKEVVMSQN